jgi:hypothetical protein
MKLVLLNIIKNYILSSIYFLRFVDHVGNMNVSGQILKYSLNPLDANHVVVWALVQAWSDYRERSNLH